jgi:hypothetical protein
MYFRKYFEGTYTPTTSTATSLTYFGISPIYPEMSRILGNAIAETMKIAGMNAWYDEDSYRLYPNKDEGAYVIWVCDSYSNSYFGHSIYYVEDSGSGKPSSSIAASTKNVPFYAGEYKFYVTYTGDPDTCFNVGIGSYASPSASYLSFSCMRATDVRNGKSVYLFSSGGFPSTFYPRYADDCSLPQSYAVTSLATFNWNYTATDANNLILRPIFSSDMIFDCADGIYAHVQHLTNGNFYKINGTVYYCGYYYMFKCPNEPNL